MNEKRGNLSVGMIAVVFLLISNKAIFLMKSEYNGHHNIRKIDKKRCGFRCGFP